MVVITDKEDVFTAINVFTVSPPDQPRLLKNLYEFIDKFVKPCEGFISASLHRSEDGRRVINYAQWESREAWLEMENNPTISKAMEEQFTIAPHADFNIYSVAAVIEHL